MFRLADRVVVDGLGSRPDLNKREGVVVKVMGTVRDDGRCGVLVDGEAEALAIKMSKLRFVVPDTSALTDHRCFGCERMEAEGETFSLCPICSDLNLPKSGAYFCGEECQALHWKRHTMSHKGAKAGRTLLSELRPDPEHPSLAAYEDSGESYKTTFAAATRAHLSGDYRKATKLLLKAIDIAPDLVASADVCLHLGTVYGVSMDLPKAHAKAAAAYEQSYARAKVGSICSVQALSNAFKTHLGTEEHGLTVPRPSWWTDKALLELSEEVAVYAAWSDEQGKPDTTAWSMRAKVLAGLSLGTWTVEPRSAAQLREAATAFMRAAKAARMKLMQDMHKHSAGQCLRSAAALECRS